MSIPSTSQTRTQSQTIGCLQLTFVTDPAIPQVTISGDLISTTVVLSRGQPEYLLVGGVSIIMPMHESTRANLTFDADKLVLGYSQVTDYGIDTDSSSGSFQL
jgi:hypothetical protein